MSTVPTITGLSLIVAELRRTENAADVLISGKKFQYEILLIERVIV